jgi:Na+-driven multidrug efflux pump
MMGNNIIRAEGLNLQWWHDYSRYCQHYIRYYFIKVMGLGMFGAALAIHFLFYVLPFVLWFFVYKSELRLKVRHFILHLPIIKEITAEFCDFSRQGVVSILAIILNHTLYSYGGTFHRRLRIIRC